MMLKMPGEENSNCHFKFYFFKDRNESLTFGGVRWSKDSFRKTLPCSDSAAKV